MAATQISDADLVHLSGMVNLEILNLISTQVTNASLIHLQKLPRLKDNYFYKGRWLQRDSNK